jgi:hypothetical protein
MEDHTEGPPQSLAISRLRETSTLVTMDTGSKSCVPIVIQEDRGSGEISFADEEMAMARAVIPRAADVTSKASEQLSETAFLVRLTQDQLTF